MIVDQLFLHSLLRSRIFIRKNPSTHTSFFSNTCGVGVFTSSRMSLFCARASRAGLYFQQEGLINKDLLVDENLWAHHFRTTFHRIMPDPHLPACVHFSCGCYPRIDTRKTDECRCVLLWKRKFRD